MITFIDQHFHVNSTYNKSCACWFKIAIIIVLFIQFTHLAYALGVRISWREDPESDIAGYKVHYGTATRNYQYSIDVGPFTNADIDGLSEGVTYYFAVSAYDTLGKESAYSKEVQATIPSSNTEENKSGGGGGSCFVSILSKK